MPPPTGARRSVAGRSHAEAVLLKPARFPLRSAVNGEGPISSSVCLPARCGADRRDSACRRAVAVRDCARAFGRSRLLTCLRSSHGWRRSRRQAMHKLRASFSRRLPGSPQQRSRGLGNRLNVGVDRAFPRWCCSRRSDVYRPVAHVAPEEIATRLPRRAGASAGMMAGEFLTRTAAIFGISRGRRPSRRPSRWR